MIVLTKRLATALTILCFVVPLTANTSARSDECTQELAESQSIASEIDVNISPNAVQVGDAVSINWATKPTASKQNKLFLVTTISSNARFRGNDFVALAPNAQAPSSIEHGKSLTRAILPLNRSANDAKSGVVEILPPMSGLNEVVSSIVYVGKCGENVLRSLRRSVAVASGSASIVTQDRFDLGAPKATLRSPSGEHIVKVYAQRFEVYDARSGHIVFSRPGLDPQFSPTGRFITATIEQGGVEVFDLAASTGEPPTFFFAGASGVLLLAWVNNDSYLVAVGSRRSNVEILNTLIDGPALLESSVGCLACNAWDDKRIIIDPSAGFVAVLPQIGSRPQIAGFIRDIYRGRPEMSSPLDRTVATINSAFGAKLSELPKRWDLGGPLQITNFSGYESPRSEFPDEKSWLSANRGVHATRRFLVAQLPEGKSTPKNAREPQPLVGERRTGRDITLSRDAIKSTRQTEIAERIEQLGVSLAPSFEIKRVFERVKVYAEQPPKNARSLAALVGPIRRGFKRQHESAKLKDDGCLEYKGANADLFDVADRIFSFSFGSRTYWIVNTQCLQGALAFLETNTYLITRDGPRYTLINLTKVESDDGGRFAGVAWSDDASRIRVFGLTGTTVAITSPLAEESKLVDVTKPESAPVKLPLVDAALVNDMRFTDDRSHIVQINSDGRFYILKTADGTQVLSGTYADDEVVIAAKDGRYDSTFEGAELVNVRFQGLQGLHRFSQFRSTLFRPGLAKAVLGGAPAYEKVSLSAPPSLSIELHPSDGARKDITGVARWQSDAPVRTLNLYTDGQLVRSIEITAQTGQLDFEVESPGSGRWVTGTIVDNNNSVSIPNSVQLPGASEARGDLHSVYIGIDKYRDGRITALNEAAYDARNLSTTIQEMKSKAFNIGSPELLLNEGATRDAILKSVRSAARKTGERDRLLLFFAGHGVRGDEVKGGTSGLYLVGHDTSLGELGQTAIAWSDLSDALSAAKGTVVIILDACHAGFAGLNGAFTNDSASSALLGGDAHRIILAASKGRQESEESSSRGGQFTNALASTLKRHTGERPTNLADVYGALKSQVMSSTSGRQTPWLVRQGLVGEMSLF